MPPIITLGENPELRQTPTGTTLLLGAEERMSDRQVAVGTLELEAVIDKLEGG